MKGKVWYVLNYIPVIPGVFDVIEIPEKEFITSVKNEVNGMNVLLSRKEGRYMRKAIPSVNIVRIGSNFDENKKFIEDSILYHKSDSGECPVDYKKRQRTDTGTSNVVTTAVTTDIRKDGRKKDMRRRKGNSTLSTSIITHRYVYTLILYQTHTNCP